MQLKNLFDNWLDVAGDRYASRQWLLSKWEVLEGVEWPKEKVDLMIATIVRGLALDRSHSLADLGCGGGWIMKLLEPYAKTTVGLDFCWDMLLNAQGVGLQGGLVQGAIGQLPFRSGSLDRALSYFVFLNFMDDAVVDHGLLDIYRILKKGGRALVGQLPDQTCSADYDREKAEYQEYCAKVYALGRSNREVCPAPQKLFDIPRLKSFLEANRIPFQILPSFNPFYRPGVCETVPWRFDVVIYKD